MEQSLYTSSFKKYIVLFIKTCLFCGLMAAAVVKLGETFKQASKENIINKYNETRFAEFYEEDNIYDLIFIGSSHAYCTFDPSIFDAELGTNSFNMGMPLQLTASTYYELKDIFEHQSPKTIVMEVYWGVMTSNFQINETTQLFQVMENDELKAEYIEKVFPVSEKIKYSVDALKYQADYFAYKSDEYDEKIRSLFGVFKPAAETHETGSEHYGPKGFVWCDYNMLPGEYNTTNQYVGLNGKDAGISSVQIRYLNKIIDLCEEKGVQLIFVTAPIAPVSMTFIENYDAIHNKINKIAEEKGIPYFDYNIINEEENLVTDANFRDDAHLNYSGAEIICRHFINLLNEKGIKLK
ncbi:MAG: DUF1574 domain-containing protein [Eubacterium sp.]|nr:DUF1574 domain-containing protein [Eubacterium sp.]